MYVSTTSNSGAVTLGRTLANSVVAAIQTKIAGGGSVFKIATQAKMLPQELSSFLGPDAGGGTFPQHQATLTLAEADQIMRGITGSSITINVAVA